MPAANANARASKRLLAGLAIIAVSLVAALGSLVDNADASHTVVAAFPVSQGWLDPAGSATFNDWDFGICGASYVPGEAHLGADSQGTVAGQTVVAISRGTVVQRLGVEANWPGGVLGIVETAADGSRFLAVYGHITPSVNVGDVVARGQAIGTIFDQGANSHVHLGIRPLAASEDGQSTPMRGESPCPPSTFGYVNPIRGYKDISPTSATRSCSGRTAPRG